MDCRQEFLEIMSPLRMGRIGELSLQVYVGGATKAHIHPMNVGQQKTDKATWYHQETPWGVLAQAPMMNVAQYK